MFSGGGGNGGGDSAGGGSGGLAGMMNAMAPLMGDLLGGLGGGAGDQGGGRWAGNLRAKPIIGSCTGPCLLEACAQQACSCSVLTTYPRAALHPAGGRPGSRAAPQPTARQEEVLARQLPPV